MALAVHVSQLDNGVVVRCEGRIVWGMETDLLERRIRGLLETLHDVVLELSGVTFIDSGGLGLLVRLMSSVRSIGGDLKLAAPSANVRKLLEITSMAQAFQLFSSPEEAISWFVHQARDAGKGSSSSGERRVLCVDESCDLLAFIRTVLQRAGYSVSTTDNVADAKLLLRASGADLLILGPNLQKIPADRTVELLSPHCSHAAIVTLGPDFHHADAAMASSQLLAMVRKQAA